MKKILVIFPLLFLSFSLTVFGATQTVPYMGTTTITPEGDKYQAANTNDSTDYWISLVVGGSQGEIIWYSADIANQTWNEISRSSTPSANIVAPPNANAFKLRSVGGGEVYMISGVTNYNDVIWEGKPSSNPDYSQVLNDILNSTNSNGEKLGSILNELKTTVNVSKPSAPVAPNIDDSDRISRNKPVENPVFKDDGTYFSDTGNDTGNAQYMTPLPSAPDVQDWDGVSKEPDGSAESPLTQDGELIKDSDLAQDGELSKDGELAQDSFTQDGVLAKDGELGLDSFTQDGVLTKDSFTSDSILEVTPMSPTENYGSTNSMTQDNFYNQTEFFNVTH